MLRSLFSIKTLDMIRQESERSQYGLRRTLGPIHLTMLGIGGIIGAGIFATLGTAAAGDAVRPGAGPALVLSFLITAFVCGFAALCYAEFASLVPISGSAYTYSYATLGELTAWVIGWDLIIEYAVGNIAVAISWANYFRTLLKGFGIVVPEWLSMDYRTAASILDSAGGQVVFQDAPHIFGIPIVFNLLAVGIVMFITLILISGIRESARLNAIMVVLKIAVLLFFIFAGLRWVKPDNWTPFAPNGWKGISTGAAIVFFAYIGFDAVSTVAEETKDPQRNMPIGIIGSLIVCTVLYVVVAAVFTGMVPFSVLKAKLVTEQAEPLTMALVYASPHLGWAVGMVAFGSVIAHTAVLLVFQLGQTRIFFSMARDGLLPPLFSKVHQRHRTPHLSTILTGVFVGGCAAFASLDEMVDLTNIGTLFAFILVCVGVVVLRIKEPHRPRPFSVPGGWGWAIVLYAGFALGVVLFPMASLGKVVLLIAGALVFALGRKHIIPLLGVIAFLYLIYYLPPASWLRFAAWLNLGFLFYASYGSIHSNLAINSREHNLCDHQVQSAYSGAWLGVFGTIILFLAHFADVVRTGIPASRGLLASHSWWLTVPLIINITVLCPILFRRVHGAQKGLLSAQDAACARRTIYLLAGLLLTCSGYLFAVIME